MPYIDVAVGILWNGGRVLVGLRRPGTLLEGYWEFPGGKVESQESPQACLCRELAEELGIKVRKTVFWTRLEHVYQEKNLTVCLHVFHVTAFTGTPVGREGQHLRWVLPKEAQALHFLPADTALLRDLPACVPEE